MIGLKSEISTSVFLAYVFLYQKQYHGTWPNIRERNRVVCIDLGFEVSIKLNPGHDWENIRLFDLVNYHETYSYGKINRDDFKLKHPLRSNDITFKDRADHYEIAIDNVRHLVRLVGRDEVVVTVVDAPYGEFTFQIRD